MGAIVKPPIDDVPRALARAPFALLAWVLSALTPTNLLGEHCRPLVLGVLLNIGKAVPAAIFSEIAAKERVFFEGLADRTRAAVMSLGEDPRALLNEALPPPTTIIDGPTVARVMFAFGHELEQRGIEGAALLSITFDEPLCDRLATRASAIDLPSEETISKAKAKRRR